MPASHAFIPHAAGRHRKCPHADVEFATKRMPNADYERRYNT
jgi:hypothetical protein